MGRIDIPLKGLFSLFIVLSYLMMGAEAGADGTLLVGPLSLFIGLILMVFLGDSNCAMQFVIDSSRISVVYTTFSFIFIDWL